MDGILAPWHWAILIAVVLLVFGPRKLPELGNSLGKGIRSFKNGLADAQDEMHTAMADAPPEKEPVIAKEPVSAKEPVLVAASTECAGSGAESPATGPSAQAPAEQS